MWAVQGHPILLLDNGPKGWYVSTGILEEQFVSPRHHCPDFPEDAVKQWLANNGFTEKGSSLFPETVYFPTRKMALDSFILAAQDSPPPWTIDKYVKAYAEGFN